MKIFVAALTTVVLAVGVGTAGARGPVVVNGGGTGTFGTDLDGDGDVDGSHFGVGATLLGGGLARGHFLCAMSGNADFLGLKLMAVSGRVTAGSLSGGSVTLTGVASVNLAHGDVFRDVPFTVTLRPGGPGVGTLELTVLGVFDGVPGDDTLGNGNYDLPPESVATGHIAIH